MYWSADRDVFLFLSHQKKQKKIGFGFPILAQALWEVLSQEHCSKPFRVQTWKAWGRESFSDKIPHIWSDIFEGSGVQMQQTWEAERVARRLECF